MLHLRDGDRLLILSASALEAMPISAGRLLRGATDVLLKADPVELLTDLVDGAGAGSGAIICRHPQTRQSVEEEDITLLPSWPSAGRHRVAATAVPCSVRRR